MEIDINKKYLHWIFNSFCLVVQAAGCSNEEIKGDITANDSHVDRFLCN